MATNGSSSDAIVRSAYESLGLNKDTYGTLFSYKSAVAQLVLEFLGRGIHPRVIIEIQHKYDLFTIAAEHPGRDLSNRATNDEWALTLLERAAS